MSPIPPTDEFSVLPSKTAELEETWQYLCKGVDHIMNKQEIGLSYKAYANLYTTIYNYCTSTRMQGKITASPGESELILSPSPALTDCYIAVGGTNLVGADLYKKLDEFFVSHSKDMLEVRWYALFHLHEKSFYYRKLLPFRMSSFFDTTPQNGIVTQQVPTIWIVCSRISIDSGSREGATEGRKTFTLSTPCVRSASLP